NWREKNIAGSGMLYDLGSHLIDQALYLFGTPNEIFADLQIQRQGGEAIDSFEIILEYPRLKVTLKSGILVKERGPHFTIHGTKGSFVKFGLDVQESDLIMGKLPKGSKEWGKEPENQWGKLNTQINGLNFIGNIESEPGDYTEYYRNVYNAILGIEDLIVTSHQARNTIRVIELAEQSSKERKWVKFQ
ncbi:MAG TPA: Gfo/Idh/MocA family oxidoreductase, partial [Clostridia bacterium]